jgi:hypothetical protein
MKVILQGRFDPPLEPKKKKIVVGCLLNPFPTELSQRSYVLGDSIVGNECLEVHKQQCAAIKNCDEKKVVSAAIPKSKVFAPMHAGFYHHENRIMKPKIFYSEFSSPKELQKKSACSMKTNSSVLQCKIGESVVSKYICMPIEHEKLTAKNGEKSLLELTGDANRSKDEDAPDVVCGLSLMSLEVTRDGTIASSTGQCCNIFQSVCKIQDKVASPMLLVQIWCMHYLFLHGRFLPHIICNG